MNERSSPTPASAPGTITRHWRVNGAEHSVSFAPLARLLDVLREQLDLISLKEGCGEGECGACSVLLGEGGGRELRLACLTAAAQLEDGTSITTAEGLATSDVGRALHRAFDEGGAVQCGYCSPGMIVGGAALLARQPRPSADEVRQALAGHLCRCTGYARIVDAVRGAAAALATSTAAAALATSTAAAALATSDAADGEGRR